MSFNNIAKINNYYNRKPIEFILSQNSRLKPILEDSSYVPRFNMKELEIFKDVPVNEPIKPSEELISKCIKYGMMILINYKGEKDKHFAGHERVIYPMVMGKSSKGKVLIRGYHLNGWSVSNNRNVKKIWRMFRLDRVLSITFTGSFYRLAPSGYNYNDKGMRGGYIARADFNEIRKNQQNLLNQQKIQNKDEVSIEKDDKRFSTIKVDNTDSILDLNNVKGNSFINQIKYFDNLRISFLKSIYGNKYIAILGAIGKPGITVKVIDTKGNKSVGTFKVIDSINGTAMKKIKRVKGNSNYELFIFNKKL